MIWKSIALRIITETIIRINRKQGVLHKDKRKKYLLE